MYYEYFIGSRYLGAKNKHSFISLISILSVAGVTVGVMALIIVISVMTGFEADLRSRILGIESHIVIFGYKEGIKDYTKITKYLESIPQVEAATPFIYTQVMLRSAHGLSGAVLRGIDPDTSGNVVAKLDASSLKKQEIKGSGSRIILGKEIARSLRVDKGDSIYVISPAGMLSPVGLVPSMKRFEVSDFFESGLYEFDGSLAYIDLNEAGKLLRMEAGTVSAVEVKLKDIYKAADIRKTIKDRLGYGYIVKDWTQMNSNLFSALKLEKTVMFIILALIILVAAFNIASALIMMVMQKTGDIAILKAMGATDKSIKKIFVFKGMTIGAIGTLTGSILGIAACVMLKRYEFIKLPGDVYYISTLPVQLEFFNVIIIAAAAMAICFVSTIYPARQASKLDPVEALRYG